MSWLDIARGSCQECGEPLAATLVLVDGKVDTDETLLECGNGCCTEASWCEMIDQFTIDTGGGVQMMSLETIRRMSDERAELAAQENMEPLVLFDVDMIHRLPGGVMFDGTGPAIPNIGSYEPPGWELQEELFVDTSGFGRPDEPALTAKQFNARLLELFAMKSDWRMGIAITQVGQFQAYIGVYRKEV